MCARNTIPYLGGDNFRDLHVANVPLEFCSVYKVGIGTVGFRFTLVFIEDEYI